VIENAPPRIRPGLVTAIALVTWFSVVLGIVVNVLIVFRLIPVTSATQQQLAGLTRLDWIILFALGAVHLTAVTLLWYLRRAALWWFMASTFLNTLNSGRMLVTQVLVNMYGILGTLATVIIVLMGYALSLVVSAAILAYIVSLYRRGALE
jgi:hypothetical protein